MDITITHVTPKESPGTWTGQKNGGYWTGPNQSSDFASASKISYRFSYLLSLFATAVLVLVRSGSLVRNRDLCVTVFANQKRKGILFLFRKKNSWYGQRMGRAGENFTACDSIHSVAFLFSSLLKEGRGREKALTHAKFIWVLGKMQTDGFLFFASASPEPKPYYLVHCHFPHFISREKARS